MTLHSLKYWTSNDKYHFPGHSNFIYVLTLLLRLDTYFSFLKSLALVCNSFTSLHGIRQLELFIYLLAKTKTTLTRNIEFLSFLFAAFTLQTRQLSSQVCWNFQWMFDILKRGKMMKATSESNNIFHDAAPSARLWVHLPDRAKPETTLTWAI